MAIQFGSAAFAADVDSLFIPASALVSGGIQSATEFLAADSQQLKESKFALAAGHVAHNYLNNLATKLGISSTQAATGSGFSHTFTYSFTAQWQIDLESEAIDSLALPTSGTNTGIGGFLITDVFPGAVKVASGDTTPSGGAAIAWSDLLRYNLATFAGFTVATSDARALTSNLFRYLSGTSGLLLRSATQTSAITAKSLGVFSTFTLPTAATASTNPTSGIASADLDKLVFVQSTSSFVVDTLLNPTTQSYEVNVI